MRVVVVGAGYFSQFQIGAWAGIEGAVLAAVADPDPARRDAVAAAHPEVSLYASAEEAVAAEAPDILDLATPPHTHAALIRASLARVRNIICQKPFCTGLDEARAVAADARAAGAQLLVHENFRFQPWHREIARLIGAGRLGDVAQARFTLRPGDGAGEDAYLSRQPYFRDMPRFLIRETGIHFIDTFRCLFGEPQAVYADLRRANPVIAGEDAGVFTFDLDGGGQVLFDGNRTLDHAARNRRFTMGEMEVEGTRAALRLNGDGAIALREQGSNDWVPHLYDFDAGAFGGGCVEAFQRHALAVFRGEETPETAATDYLRNLEIEALVYRSSEEGRKLPAGADR